MDNPKMFAKRLRNGLRSGIRTTMDPALELYPAGHFYSPIPNAEARAKAGSGPSLTDELMGIDLQIPEQLALLDRLSHFYSSLPFSQEPTSRNRYFYQNSYFGFTDAIIYATLLLERPPTRVIEVGSGYSSALLIDMNEIFFNHNINTTFIEPYPDRLRSLVRAGDLTDSLHEKDLQSMSLNYFDDLSNGDILFIDSTHVSKFGSDVNYLFFQILPRLPSGVRIHIHDVFFPFEYPTDWIKTGRAWNEDYLVRAFLQFNSTFKILLFNNYLNVEHEALLNRITPMCSLNHGGSLWIEVV